MMMLKMPSYSLCNQNFRKYKCRTGDYNNFNLVAALCDIVFAIPEIKTSRSLAYCSKNLLGFDIGILFFSI